MMCTAGWPKEGIDNVLRRHTLEREKHQKFFWRGGQASMVWGLKLPWPINVFKRKVNKRTSLTPGIKGKKLGLQTTTLWEAPLFTRFLMELRGEQVERSGCCLSKFFPGGWKQQRSQKTNELGSELNNRSTEEPCASETAKRKWKSEPNRLRLGLWC